MLSPFIVQDKPIHLDRFPIAQVNRSLQAWDATDEYLLSYCQEQEYLVGKKNILIVNDSFGAIACNLTKHKIYCVSDSYLSHQGCRYNIEQNNLADDTISYLDSLSELPESINLILYRIPKSRALLSHQLAQIAGQYGETTKFIAGARAKDIHSSTLKVFEHFLGETQTSLAVKKSRLVFSLLSKPAQQTLTSNISWPLERTKFNISNHAGVFSRESLDIGARFFLQHLPKVKPEQTVIDLGCGNGVIGLSVLANQAGANLIFKDESYMAIASTHDNISENLPNLLAQCRFEADDCLTNETNSSADLILCNPPFHQQHATTDHIAWQMFNDSKRVLKSGGELRIIGNRQLGYHIKLKRIFGNCTTIASNKKFVVLSSIKS
ncbi:methyltransferase [Thalassotalea sp. M1531]|uniref:Ribosomal RNA large subunit methyltransferase G n=1 Tax=Thalassotalea algicola TaxID=2716224 RepID=A0A7Y0LD85_9GAMM|nr:methyltransferase [Thalassotalea algicola]NMP32182.1 methyltransferase [Thalassotalea algicola]